MGFSASLLSQTSTRTKVIVPEAHFHAESIAASPVVIGRKTAKLFKLYAGQLNLVAKNGLCGLKSIAPLKTASKVDRVVDIILTSLIAAESEPW